MAEQPNSNTSTGNCMAGTCQHPNCGRRRVYSYGAFLIIALSALVVTKVITEVRSYKYIGQNPTQEATITVTGDADKYTVPDVAQVSYAVEFLGKTPKEAKDEVAKKTEAITAFLKESGVDVKDIQTVGYNLNPEYDWVQERVVACTITYCPPQPAGKQVIRGYRVTENYEVKFRGDNFDKAGDIIGGLAEKGATNVSGLDFRVDGQEAILESIRGEAIKEARAKAEKLAAELGVSIVRIQAYNEGTNYPMFNNARAGGVMMKLEAADAAPSVNIQPGQEKLTTSVTITYVVQ